MQLKNPLFRAFSVFVCLALINIAVPESLLVAEGIPLKEAVSARVAEIGNARAAMARRRAVSRTRLLSSKETYSLQGRTAQCPYTAGVSKWDPSFQGVDLVTGNYSTSATDLSFDGGYGIPVNVTRSYSANDANEGPFGFGWTLSADVRTTAGGILKSKTAPVRSVPTTYKERAPLETDPNVSAQPVEAVTAEDASGRQETIQKDADGVLSPAAWDQNQSVTQYQAVVQNGSSYQVMSSQTMTTPDGTVYQYVAEGSYLNGGTVPYNNSTATPTPANILKCVSATDRNGNTTTYTYGSGTVNFTKIDGTTQEHPLVGVQMPNGHTITFAWGNGTSTPSNRIVQVYDNNQARIVNYGYSGGNLTSVTSPAGLTTYYGYGSAVNNYNTDVPGSLMTSITDPRGLTTWISYFVGIGYVAPYGSAVESVIVDQVNEPNGITDNFYWVNNDYIEPNWGNGTTSPGFVCNYTRSAPGLSNYLAIFYDAIYVSGNSLEVQQYSDQEMKPSGPPVVDDFYDIFTQSHTGSDTNTVSYNYTVYGPYSNLDVARQLGASAFNQTICSTSNNFNFMGNPLDVTTTETEYLYNSSTVVTPRVATTSYAYWDSTKYYQQKAVKDPGGRISFTDYYTATDPNPGNRGQTYQVWDPKYGGTGTNSTSPPPGTQPQDTWRYQVFATAGQYSGQFSYDTLGRPTTVLKLQAATAGSPSTYRYVTTQTSYNGGSSAWGQASQVVEDAGGINRTTLNNGYTAWGKADDVTDGAGHRFVTSYDNDEKVKSVTEVGAGTIASYTYGASGVSNGQVTGVTDGLSGVTEQIQYQSAAGGGIGQPASVSESRNGTLDNVCTYTYSTAGDRLTATYTNGSGAVLGQWGYYDYIEVGAPTKASRAFQTLCKLDGNGNRTADEFHYAFDTQGRLLEAAFAQTPSDTTPDSNGYYDGHLAQTRARAHYEYDPGGRLYWIAHYWDTLSNGAYTSEAILAQGCDYEETTTAGANLNRGVKLDSKYYTRMTAGQPNWTLSQTDTYSYDPSLDYLTGATYGDGLANASPAWSYDAAGNRNDTVADNLNRPETISGVNCTSDILGNRLTMGSNTYSWDALNRMTSYSSTNYAYRADGMRISKSNSNGVTSYRYDGQMGMEDIDFAGNGTTVLKTTDYGIGARGVDAMYVTQNGTTTATYPIYDGHGNMISTLTKLGTGSYAFSAVRTFDAWGNIRVGAQTGDPKGRYCANLGHKQDDESGLVYMRARYYEPTSGRFVSPDPGRHGLNWFAYCSNNPISRCDRSGQLDQGEIWGILAILCVAAFLASWVLLVGVAPQLESQMQSALAAVERCREAIAGASQWTALQNELTNTQQALSAAESSASLNCLGMVMSKIAGYIGLIASMEMANELYDLSDGKIDGFCMFASAMGWQNSQ
jgi:RHS repeat-associated protein